ncbi:MAG: hypothetical protein J4N97_09635 [Chloroflexi bacterium]|nr:hypothetical protein [Chloroflexota bacterium]
MSELFAAVETLFRHVPAHVRKELARELVQTPLFREAIKAQPKGLDPELPGTNARQRAPNPRVSAPREKVVYDAPGVFSGRVNGAEVIVSQDEDRRFPFGTLIDGVAHRRLSMSLVEQRLGIEVLKKNDGTNAETVSRAIFRHLADRYNDGDTTITFDEYYRIL